MLPGSFPKQIPILNTLKKCSIFRQGLPQFWKPLELGRQNTVYSVIDSIASKQNISAVSLV